MVTNNDLVESIIASLKELYYKLMYEANQSASQSKSYYYFSDMAAGVYTAINVIEDKKYRAQRDENTQ